MTDKTCCFFGHRVIEDSLELRTRLGEIILSLITQDNIDTFLFGSKSQFDSLCHHLVTKAKEKYPHIKRIYIRAEYPYIDDRYKAYLLENYEGTYYCPQSLAAGKAAYIHRNRFLVDQSRICVVYYLPSCVSLRYKSGTKMAYDYAIKQHKKVINAADKPRA